MAYQTSPTPYAFLLPPSAAFGLLPHGRPIVSQILSPWKIANPRNLAPQVIENTIENMHLHGSQHPTNIPQFQLLEMENAQLRKDLETCKEEKGTVARKFEIETRITKTKVAETIVLTGRLESATDELERLTNSQQCLQMKLDLNEGLLLSAQVETKSLVKKLKVAKTKNEKVAILRDKHAKLKMQRRKFEKQLKTVSGQKRKIAGLNLENKRLERQTEQFKKDLQQREKQILELKQANELKSLSFEQYHHLNQKKLELESEKSEFLAKIQMLELKNRQMSFNLQKQEAVTSSSKPQNKYKRRSAVSEPVRRSILKNRHLEMKNKQIQPRFDTIAKQSTSDNQRPCQNCHVLQRNQLELEQSVLSASNRLAEAEQTNALLVKQCEEMWQQLNSNQGKTT